MKRRFQYILGAILTLGLVSTPLRVMAEDGVTTTKKQSVEERVKEIESRSEEKIAQIKEKTETRTKEVRQKACESRQSNIANRLSSRVEAAKRHKTKFDAIYKRVSDYAVKDSLSSDEITALKATVDTKSDQANSEITVLESMDVSLDCTNPDSVAAKIESFKSQLGTVKTALKDYREAIRAYAQAVKKLAEATEGTL